MALGGLIPILELLNMDGGLIEAATPDALPPRWRLFPPVPGAPWLWAMPRPRPNAGLEQTEETPLRPAFLFDENANTPERLRRLSQMIAQTMNALIRKGRLTVDFLDPDNTDVVLSNDQIEDALGYVPADEDTAIPVGPGVAGGGTLGAPETIRVDDTVVRLLNQGGGKAVVYLPSATVPSANPPSGVYLYIDGDTLKTRDSSGVIV